MRVEGVEVLSSGRLDSAERSSAAIMAELWKAPPATPNSPTEVGRRTGRSEAFDLVRPVAGAPD